MFKQWIIFIFLVLFSTQAFAVSGLGLQFYVQTLNSTLTLKDESKREVVLAPEPPSFTGVGASYEGFGASYAWTSTGKEDRAKRSEASGFKWTVPYKYFLFEFYKTEFEGSGVEGAPFRTDIDVFAQGGHVTWFRKKDKSFSSLFGLEESLSEGERPTQSHTYFTLAFQESIWRGDTSFWPTPTGTDDTLAFRYIRRRTGSFGVGKTVVKYFDKFRFSALGNIGPFGGNRFLKYENGNLPNDKGTEWGVAVSAGFALASDVGFRRLGKKWDTHFNYGINFLFHYSGSFDDESIGTTQSAAEVYLGALF